MKEYIQKFIAFEWLMFWIFGLFWAGAMFLPLFSTCSFDSKADRFNSFFIMFGPYLVYFTLRALYLLWKMLVWSYLTSNFFFKTRQQQIFADELFRFLIFGPVWAMIISGPMYLAGYFKPDTAFYALLVGYCGPYTGYLLLKGFVAFLGSFRWAVRVTVRQ